MHPPPPPPCALCHPCLATSAALHSQGPRNYVQTTRPTLILINPVHTSIPRIPISDLPVDRSPPS